MNTSDALPIDTGEAWSQASTDLCGRTPSRLETELVAAARAGDEAAFGQLVERHEDLVYRFCFRWLRNAADAQEACQDTFVRAYQGLARYRHQGRFSTWLYRIALNRCRDRLRSPRLEDRGLPVTLDAASREEGLSGRGPDAACLHRSDLRTLEDCLARLPASLREPLILCAIEGLSHEESARIIGCSIRAIEGRIYRARRMIQDWWPAR